jgi:hypothetical protein
MQDRCIREEVNLMRNRLIKLTGVLLISGASTVALAMPASAATITATSVKSSLATSLSRYAETSTGTSTGTPSAFITELATYAVFAGFGPQLVATVVK